MKHLVGSLMCAVCVVACSTQQEPAAAAEQAVVDGEIDLSDQGRSAVTVVSNDGITCSGTLIAPDWVLLAAHCIGNWSRSRVTVFTGEELDGGLRPDAGGGDAGPPPQAFETATADRCYIHPEAYRRVPACQRFGATGDTCESTQSALDCFERDTDIALLHLEDPVTFAPTRSIAPPRLCGTEEEPGVDAGPSDLFRFRFRGFGGFTGNPPRMLVHGAARRSGARVEGFVDTPGRIRSGDSGGGLTAEADDVNGPVVAVAESVPGFGGSASQAFFGFVWHPSTIEFIWSTIDASGSCRASAFRRPCVLRERLPEGPDGGVADHECGDGACTGSEDNVACPEDCSPRCRTATGMAFRTCETSARTSRSDRSSAGPVIRS